MTKSTTLPRGIQLVTRTTAEGLQSVRYRVRINRDGYKTNKYFDDLKEAVSFLTLSKTEKGKELIYSISEEERLKIKLELQRENNKNFTFGYFANLYLSHYVFNGDPDDKESLKKKPELIRRNQAMKKAFLSKICNISIPDRYITFEERQNLGIPEEQETVYRFFKDFDVRTEIKPIDINNYIKARLKGDKKNRAVMPVSVVRELTFISNVFSKLIHFDESLEDIENPTRKYDKSLLQNVINHRKRVLTEEEETEFLELINGYQNKELADICKLSLLTSMRKSEIVFLKQDQILDDGRRIFLPITKSKKPRDVYLDETAREFIKQLQPSKKAKDGRLFSYSNYGFSRVFTALMSKSERLKDLHFHDLRRTKISRMLSIGGEKNTILVAKILGFSSIRKFEEIHLPDQQKGLETQEGMLGTFGHGSIDVNYKHYFNITLDKVNKLTTIKNLRKKKSEIGLTADEEKELLDLLLEITE